MKQRKPSKMKAAHIFAETIAHYFCADTGRIAPPSSLKCVSLNSPRMLIIHESLDSMQTKSPGYGNAPPKPPKSRQHRTFQNRREPIRIIPRYLHSRIQVKTIFLREQGSCLPAKPSPGEHITVWESWSTRDINKSKIKLNGGHDERTSFHAWPCFFPAR